MQFKKIAFLLISVILMVTGCDSKKDNEDNNKENVSQKKETKFTVKTQLTPAITMEKTAEGMNFKELNGKVVLLNFFATWCPPCKAEIPHLVNLRNKYNDKFEIVALNMGNKSGSMSKADEIQNFIDEFGINYPVSNEENNFKISDIMGNIRIIPTMFLFDTKGHLVQKYVGIVPEEMLETDIKKALGI